MINRTAIAVVVALVVGYFLGRINSSGGAQAPSLDPVPAVAAVPVAPAPAPAPKKSESKSVSRESAQALGGTDESARETPAPARFIVIDFSEKNVEQMEADARSFGPQFVAAQSSNGWQFSKIPEASLLHRLGLRAGDSIYTMQVDDLRASHPELQARVRSMLDGFVK